MTKYRLKRLLKKVIDIYPCGRTIGLEVTSGDGDENKGAKLNASLFRHSVSIWLPQWLLRPKHSWVDLSNESWARTRPDGRKGYDEYTPRTYGFYLFENHFNVMYGLDNDGDLQQRWSCFLPWTTWRFHALRTYDRAMRLHGERIDSSTSFYDELIELADDTPKVHFSFLDYDGTPVNAETHVSERQWKKGEGAFKWLSLIMKDKVVRQLEVRYSEAVGQEKNSWKGGTLSCSITMGEGENHEAAFKRLAAGAHFDEVRRIS